MFTETRFVCGLLLVVLSCALSLPAQQNSAPQPDSGKIFLDVVVSPKSGPPVGDLQQQDFTILDNKSPQTVTSFAAISGREAPIQVLLVIDAVNSDASHLSYQRGQIDKFLRAEGGHLAYPVAVALFTDKGVQIVEDFSSDGNALSSALDNNKIGLRFIGRSAGFYGAADRLQYSLAALRQLIGDIAPRPGRKLILWVSPGWPLLSGPRLDITSKEQQQIFADVVAFSTQLRQARITLYSVNPLGAGESVYRGSYYQEFLKGVSKPSQVQPGDLGLPVLAIQSGGLALDFNNDLSALLQRCITETVPYYELSFDPPPSDHPDEFHHIEIKVSKPGLTARARQGYYAQPLPSAK
jgi:VWFA-related protein